MEVWQQWQALVAEYEQAKRDADAGFIAVSRKFAEVAAGSRRNPTVEDCDQWDAARERLADVDRRMNEFARKHARD